MTTQDVDYHHFMQMQCTPEELPGIVVPQQVYVSPISHTQLLPPVRFTINGQLGIRLADALNPAFTGLDNHNSSPSMSQTGVRVAFRILWPGYDSWHINMPVFDNTAATNPLNLLSIARRVAANIQQFYHDMHAVQPVAHDEATANWRLANIPFHQLYLVELRHVSQGSWQPVLCYRAN